MFKCSNRDRFKCPFGAGLLAAALLLVSALPIRAQEPPFYAKKTVTITVGFGPAGSYDLYSRLLAPFLAKHIPGNPTVIVANRPGAGGMMAFVQAGTQGPKDGTLVTIVSQGLLMQELVGAAGIETSLADYRWVGNITQDNNVTATWGTSPIKSMADATKREVILAASGAGSTSTQMPLVYNYLLGTKFKAIMGYEGGAAANLAMERGETEGRATNTWSSYRASYGEPRPKLNVLVQIGLRRDPELPDVPLLTELVKDDARKHAIALLISQSLALARCFAAPPGVAPDRVDILRRAFDASVKDTDLLAQAKKQGLDIGPMPGEEVQRIITQVLKTPPDLREGVKLALGMQK